MEIKPTLLLVEDDVNDAALFRLAFEKLFPNVRLETVLLRRKQRWTVRVQTRTRARAKVDAPGPAGLEEAGA